MKEENKSSGGGLGILTIMFLIMFGLKLAGIITFSWWWVTAPLWGGVLLIIVLAILITWANTR